MFYPKNWQNVVVALEAIPRNSRVVHRNWMGHAAPIQLVQTVQHIGSHGHRKPPDENTPITWNEKWNKIFKIKSIKNMVNKKKINIAKAILVLFALLATTMIFHYEKHFTEISDNIMDITDTSNEGEYHDAIKICKQSYNRTVFSQPKSKVGCTNPDSETICDTYCNLSNN